MDDEFCFFLISRIGSEDRMFTLDMHNVVMYALLLLQTYLSMEELDSYARLKP